MKNILYTILMLFVLVSANAQVPQKMTYQAVLRNQSNALLSNERISMKISILQGDSLSNPIYTEYQTAYTNLNGLVTIQIGTGMVMYGNFTNIDWTKGQTFIKTETDPEGGLDFRIIGTNELLSVPFAFYAAKSNFDTTSIYKNINDLQKQSLLNKSNIQSNLDSIIINSNNLKIYLDTLNSKLNRVDFNTLLQGYQKIGKFVSAISLQGVDSFDVNINGNFIASKNVTIGGNIESLGTTSTLGTLEKPFKGLFISSGSLSIASDTLGKNIPAAILSNVEGNLQISAGGLKLMGNNTSFIAPRIVSNLTGNATTATKLDTARKINGVAFDGTTDILLPNLDTTYLSNRINLKLSSTDTSAMLSNRIAKDTTYLSNRINLKLSSTDTSSMLSNRIARDTTYLSNRINLKLSSTDTSSMLSNRIARDTNYLSNRINLKLNTSGNQTLSGNLTVNDLTISNSHNLTTPTITFSDGKVQKHSSDVLLVGSQDGNQNPFLTLDLTKQVFTFGDGHWYLPDGAEGQICYFVLNTGGSPEDITVIVRHLRITNASVVANANWQPFLFGQPATSVPGLVTAIYSGGAWSVSSGTKYL